MIDAEPKWPISITGWLPAVAGAGRGEWWGTGVIAAFKEHPFL